MRFEGGAQLAKNLSQLSERLSKELLRKALRDGGEIMRVQASRNAPYEPGKPDLRDNIGMSTARPDDAVPAAIAVGPTKAGFYGLFQEFGTAHHSAQPFLRPAFDSEQGRALAAISRSLWISLIGKGFSSRVGQGPSEAFGEAAEPMSMGGPGGSIL